MIVASGVSVIGFICCIRRVGMLLSDGTSGATRGGDANPRPVLLHGRSSPLGHKPLPRFMLGMEELASIPDANTRNRCAALWLMKRSYQPMVSSAPAAPQQLDAAAGGRDLDYGPGGDIGAWGPRKTIFFPPSEPRYIRAVPTAGQFAFIGDFVAATPCKARRRSSCATASQARR